MALNNGMRGMRDLDGCELCQGIANDEEAMGKEEGRLS